MKNSIGKITAVICCAALAAVSCLFPAAVYVPAQAAVLSRSQITVAIDPGHQKKQDLGMERVDPDNAKLGKKYKMAGGCSSVYNHMGEYRYTLIIAKKLRADLLKRGYKVYMVRTSNDVDLSCRKRARMVNASGSRYASVCTATRTGARLTAYRLYTSRGTTVITAPPMPRAAKSWPLIC